MMLIGAFALLTIFFGATPAAAGNENQGMTVQHFFTEAYNAMDSLNNTVSFADPEELFDKYQASIMDSRFDTNKFASLLWIRATTWAEDVTLTSKSHKLYICHGSANHYVGLNVDFNSLVKQTANGHFFASHNNKVQKMDDFLLGMQGISSECNAAGSAAASIEAAIAANKIIGVCGDWAIYADDEDDANTDIYKVSGHLALVNVAGSRHSWSISNVTLAYQANLVEPGTYAFGTVTADGIEMIISGDVVSFPFKCACCEE